MNDVEAFNLYLENVTNNAYQEKRYVMYKTLRSYSIRNNTSNDITDIQVRIIKFDASGVQVDYSDVNLEDESIAPGLARKFIYKRSNKIYSGEEIKIVIVKYEEG